MAGGVNVGTLEALLKLRDELTPSLAAAARNITKFANDNKASLAIVGAASAAAVGAVVAVGAAFVAAGASMVKYASNVVDLADKYKLSTDAVQKFAYAASQSGTDVNKLLDASSKLSKNLGEGTDKTVEAVNRLGLSMTALRNSTPEKALSDVLRAVSAIKNPTEQAAVAAQLLGRGFRDLMIVGGDLDKLTQKAEELGLVLTEKDLRAAEELGDALDTLMAIFDGLVNNIGSAITSNETLHVVIQEVTKVFAELSKGIHDNKQFMSDLVSGGIIFLVNAFSTGLTVIGYVVDAFSGLQIALTAASGYYELIGIAAIKAWEAIADPKNALKKWDEFKEAVADVAKRTEESINKTMDSNKKYQDTIAMVKGKTDALADTLEKTRGKQHEVNKETEKAVDKGKEQAKVLTDVEKAAKKLQDTLTGGKVSPEMQLLADAVMEVQKNGAVIPEQWHRIKKEVEEAKKQGQAIPEILQDIADKSLEVRNGVIGVTSALFANDRLQGNLNGSRLSPGIKMEAPDWKASEEAGKKAAADAAAKAADAYAKSFKGQMSQGLKELPNVVMGAIQGGGNIGAAVGSHFGTIVGNSLKGPATAALSSILGKGLGSALGGLVPGIGAIAGPIVGKFIGDIGGKVFGGIMKTEGKKVNDMRDEFMAAGGGLEELGAKAAAVGMTLTNLLKADTVKEYTAAVNELTGAFDMQGQSQQLVNEAVERYGFTLEELGPKWAQQELDVKAGALLQDYNLLTAAGIDHTAIVGRMGPALNEYVNASMAAGTTIPENMRPALEKMLEMGTLTDAAGNKMESLDGLNFTESLSEGLTRAIEGINRLVAALTGMPAETRTRVVVERSEVGGSGGGERGGGYEKDDYDVAAADGFHGMVYGPTSFITGEGGRPERVDITPAGEMRTGGGGGDNSAAVLAEMRAMFGRMMDDLPRELAAAYKRT
jgi:hypothetical protein